MLPTRVGGPLHPALLPRLRAPRAQAPSVEAGEGRGGREGARSSIGRPAPPTRVHPTPGHETARPHLTGYDPRYHLIILDLPRMYLGQTARPPPAALPGRFF